jgi:hypothetical protein
MMTVMSRISHLILALTLGLFFLFLQFLLAVLPARAVDLTVLNTNDSGSGSLRQAIADAGHGDTILFDNSLNGQTITLTSGQLLITKNLTISGPGAKLLAISGYNASRVFWITSTVTISGLTIKEGSVDGGGINNDGTVTLINSIVSDNTVTGFGGGIWNFGTVILTNSTISENTADGASGIYNVGGTVSLENSTVSSNTTQGEGGGIYNSGGTVTLNNSALSGNSAVYGGGILNTFGILNNSGGMITLNNTTIEGNSATNGGGIATFGGTVTLISSTLSDNFVSLFGGGIWNFSTMPMTITLTNSTLSGNSANSGGGGIDNGHTATITLTNSTLSGNSANYAGGGIRNFGILSLENSTLRGNSASLGGGVFNFGIVNLENSTLSNNTTQDQGGGILNNIGGTVSLENSTVSSNTTQGEGGGISNAFGGMITLTNSTLSGNSASLGGGVFNFGIASLRNSTLSNNTTQDQGGGILNNIDGMVSLENSTVSSNTTQGEGGGISNAFGGMITLTNSTLSGNSAGLGGGVFNFGIASLRNSVVSNSPTGRDCSGSIQGSGITSQGYNLDSDNTCNLTATGDITNTNPLLDPLADNGGNTLTHALQDGSLAIDHIPIGTNGCGTMITTDQRGVVRPQGGGCDIGAFELGYIYLPFIFKNYDKG